jgi:hypothetical protein
MKQCARAAVVNGVGIGALVSLKVDCCTCCHAQGLLVIVYKFNTDIGGVFLFCEHGIVTHNGTATLTRCPTTSFKVIATNGSTFIMLKKLQGVCDKVLAGNFINDAAKPIAFTEVNEKDIN